MDDKQFNRAVKSVGLTCFVENFELFKSTSVRENVVETLKTKYSFTDKSCNSRTSHARSIILNGFENEVFERVLASSSPKIRKTVREKAKKHLSIF